MQSEKGANAGARLARGTAACNRALGKAVLLSSELCRTASQVLSRGDVSALEGKPVRLRFVMKDADLYALRFR